MQLEENKQCGCFDCHIHIGVCEGMIAKQEKDLFISREQVINYLDRNGIQEGLIFPFPNQRTSSLKTNQYVVETLQEHKRRLYGLAYFTWGDDPENLRRVEDCNSIVGVKVHPCFAKKEITKIPSSVLKVVRKNNWFLLVDSSISPEGHPKHIVRFAENNPDIPIICAHMARLFHREVLEIAKLDNVYIDISGIFLLSGATHRIAPASARDSFLRKSLSASKILKYLLRFIDKKKIIWGSDFPFFQLFGGERKINPPLMIDRILSSLDENIPCFVLGRNMNDLLQSLGHVR